MGMSKHRALGIAFAVAASAGPASAGVPLTAVTSNDGLVTIAAPQTPGWECVEHTSATPYPSSLMRCRRKVAGEFFLLTARQYQVPPQEQKTAEQLASQVFPQDYKTFYASYKITGTAPVTHQGLSGVELQVDAIHAVKGELRKVEQVFAQGRSVFVLSAEGARVQFGSWKVVIDGWMAGARFKALAGKTDEPQAPRAPAAPAPASPSPSPPAPPSPGSSSSPSPGSPSSSSSPASSSSPVSASASASSSSSASSSAGPAGASPGPRG